MKRRPEPLEKQPRRTQPCGTQAPDRRQLLHGQADAVDQKTQQLEEQILQKQRKTVPAAIEITARAVRAPMVCRCCGPQAWCAYLVGKLSFLRARCFSRRNRFGFLSCKS